MQGGLGAGVFDCCSHRMAREISSRLGLESPLSLPLPSILGPQSN